jgi:hypothetical protein
MAARVQVRDIEVSDAFPQESTESDWREELIVIGQPIGDVRKNSNVDLRWRVRSRP